MRDGGSKLVGKKKRPSGSEARGRAERGKRVGETGEKERLIGSGEKRERGGDKRRQRIKGQSPGPTSWGGEGKEGRGEGARRGNCQAGAPALRAARLPGETADTLRRCYSGVGDDDKYDNLYKI